jgi:POT family proton-dependent oligopeptide transporter
MVNLYIERTGGLEGASYYWFFVKVMLVTAVLFVFVAAFYKEKTYIQDEGGI